MNINDAGFQIKSDNSWELSVHGELTNLIGPPFVLKNIETLKCARYGLKLCSLSGIPDFMELCPAFLPPP